MTDWHFFVPNPPAPGAPFWNFSESTFRQVPADQPVSFSIASGFSDGDGDVLTFSIVNDGGWGASIDALNGVVSGPAIPDGETRNITVDASDGAQTAMRALTIRATLLPIYTGPDTFFPEIDQNQIVIDFSELYIDPLGGDLTYTLVNGIEALPDPSAMLDENGVFTIDFPEFGFYDFSVEATNAEGTTGPYLTIGGFQVN